MKQANINRTILAIALLSVLSACGGREALKPRTGEAMPQAPLGDPTPPTAEELITADTQARPGRSDEVLRRSEERKDDRFDLPPPG